MEDEKLLLTPEEKKMLECLFKKPLTEEDIHDLTDGLDIDKCNQNYLLMLSCLGFSQGWGSFPREMIPRLQGIHRYFQVYNTMWIPWLLQKIHALREADIPVMLLKGLAMRFYYVPGMPRIMNDFDIAVPEEKYTEAMRLLQDEESSFVKETIWHGVVQGRHISLEIHRWIFKNHEEKDTDIWERAIRFNFQGEEVFVPGPEDMLIHQLHNRSEELDTGTHLDRRINWLHDCRRVLEFFDSPDLNRLSVRAEEFGVTYSVRQMLLLFSDCFPDVIPRSEIDSAFPDTLDYQRWREERLAFREFFQDFAAYRNAAADHMTPVRALRILEMYGKYYRYERKKWRSVPPGWNFLKYMKGTWELKSFGDLLQFLLRYGPKIQLPGGNKKASANRAGGKR